MDVGVVGFGPFGLVVVGAAQGVPRPPGLRILGDGLFQHWHGLRFPAAQDQAEPLAFDGGGARLGRGLGLPELLERLVVAASAEVKLGQQKAQTRVVGAR